MIRNTIFAERSARQSRMSSGRSCRIEPLESRALLSASLSSVVTMGGSEKDRGNDVASDSAGNSYVVGVYNGPADFDPSSGTKTLPGTGSDDAFVAKYTPAGALSWAKSFTGVGTQEIQAVAVDKEGNVYVTGYFESTVDFDPNSGTHNLTSRGGEDGFLLKLTSSGDYVWSRQFGGASPEGGVAITTDASGNVYVQGLFEGDGEYGATTGAAPLKSAGGFDAFVLKFDRNGNLAFAKSLGGSGDEFVNGIAVDASGNIVTIGTFSGTADFDPSSSSATLKSAGAADVFIAKWTSSGGYIFAKRLGGSGLDGSGDLALDSSGNIYATGSFTGSADFDPNSGTTTLKSKGDTDAFIVKLTSSGALSWAKRIGGTDTDRGNDILLDGKGNLFVAGAYSGTVDFDPGSGDATHSSKNGTQDAFLVKLTTDATFVWSARWGGTSELDEAEGLAMGSKGAVILAGAFGNTVDFDPGSATKNKTASGSKADVFVLQLLG